MRLFDLPVFAITMIFTIGLDVWLRDEHAALTMRAFWFNVWVSTCFGVFFARFDER